jgi:hypothetical protein
MTPSEFVTALFGEGWTEGQLPVFLNMLMRVQEDAGRYLELRDALAKGDELVASRKSLNSVDDFVDSVRQSGYQ